MSSTYSATLSSANPTTYKTEGVLKRFKREFSRMKSCGNGNDFYDGGGDIDTVTYSGERHQFFIIQNLDHSYTVKDLVKCRVDTDTVINVERFLFGQNLLTLETLNPDRVESKRKRNAPTVSLVGPKNGALFSLGQDIPIQWEVKNAPKNSQVIFRLTLLVRNNLGNIGGGSGQTDAVDVGASAGSHSWTTGGVGRLDTTGTYRVDALLRGCDPKGCQFNAEFLGNPFVVKTYAVADPVVISIK
jgi:hypothetical protein